MTEAKYNFPFYSKKLFIRDTHVSHTKDITFPILVLTVLKGLSTLQCCYNIF